MEEWNTKKLTPRLTWFILYWWGKGEQTKERGPWCVWGEEASFFRMCILCPVGRFSGRGENISWKTESSKKCRAGHKNASFMEGLMIQYPLPSPQMERVCSFSLPHVSSHPALFSQNQHHPRHPYSSIWHNFWTHFLLLAVTGTWKGAASLHTRDMFHFFLLSSCIFHFASHIFMSLGHILPRACMSWFDSLSECCVVLFARKGLKRRKSLWERVLLQP